MRIFLCAALLAGLSALEAAAQSRPSATPMPASATPPAVSSVVKAYALRLRPGQDLRHELVAFAQQHQLRAAAVLTCVGSLTTTSLRLANQEGPTHYHGHFEIVSLVGTLSVNGSHLHLSVADSTGRTLGGHLLEGSVVYTTAEIVLSELPELDFRREPDPTYGYQELTVYPAPKPPRRAPTPKKSR